MTRRGEAVDTEQDDVEQLVELSRLLVTVAYRSLGVADSQVSLPQFRALVTIARIGPCNAGSLATQLGLHNSSVTRLCDKLVAAGLLTREVKEGNRREVELALTAAGGQVVDSVLSRRAAEVSRMLERLSPAVRARLGRVLPSLLGAAAEVVTAPHSARAI